MVRLAIRSPDGNRMVAASFDLPLREAMRAAVSRDCPAQFQETREPDEAFDRICICHSDGWHWVRPN